MITSLNNGLSHKPSIIDAIIKQGVKSAPLVEKLGSKPITNFVHAWINDRYRDAKDNANVEITGLGETPTPTKTKTQNSCQIIKNELGVSERQKHISQWGEAELPYQRAKVGIEHVKDIEYALLGLGNADIFSAPVTQTATKAGRMAGLFYFVPDDHKKQFGTGNGGATLTEFTLEHFHQMLEPIWKNGGIDDESFEVYMGNVLKGRVNKWLEKMPYLRAEVKDEKINPLITYIATDFGDIAIKLHRQFATPKLQDKVLLGKFDEAKICYLTKTKLDKVVTDKTADYERYYTDLTLEITNADYFSCGMGLK